MTPTELIMKQLRERDYTDLREPDHLRHLIIMRDRVAYYALQLRPFQDEKPNDLPVQIDGRTYRAVDIEILQRDGMSVPEYYSLLTDIEAALFEAAARRGFPLKNRGKIDEVGSSGALRNRSKTVRGRAPRK